jgi:hypothetical protein
VGPVLGIVVALVAFPVWAGGDALVRPRSAWATVGHHKAVWVLGTAPPPVLALAFASAGWFRAIVLAADVVAYAYMVKVRPLVRLAQGLHRAAGDDAG